ncbi:MAG: hypothetical protein ACLFPS_09065 [Clostridia bacterium]
MLKQKEMISKVKKLCREDNNLVNAMMYGSFAKGGGDQYSDIEFAFFFKDNYLEGLDKKLWLENINDIDLCFTNMFGIETVIFNNLVRGEFHFYKASEVSLVESWVDTDWFKDINDSLIVDKNGELVKYLSKLIGNAPRKEITEKLQSIIDSYFNWLLFGINLIARGEYARSLDILWWVQRDLLKLKRIEINSLDNFGTPSKELKLDLSREDYIKYIGCTANLDGSQLVNAYKNCYKWSKQILLALKQDNSIFIHQDLLLKIGKKLDSLQSPSVNKK